MCALFRSLSDMDGIIFPEISTWLGRDPKIDGAKRAYNLDLPKLGNIFLREIVGLCQIILLSGDGPRLQGALQHVTRVKVQTNPNNPQYQGSSYSSDSMQ